MPTDKQTFAIVGAGLAGAKAAETLREEGYDGRLVLLGAEPERPYERPPLSKEYLRGETDREQAYVHEAGFYEEHGIELRSGEHVVRLDPGRRELTLQSDERLAYDRLLLATGSAPRRLSIPGSELEGVHYLRTFGDSDALRARLDAGGRLVVIGAGWIGCEVAASARQRGLEVTVIAPHPVPFERVLGSELGAIYRDIHVDHGVEMLFGTAAAAFEGADSVERVRPNDGRTIDCDSVVVGIGATPRALLAAAAGLAVDNGILVDERLETSAPGVFAAGDVANQLHPVARPPSRRALGQRAPARTGCGAEHARVHRGLRAPAVLLLRPVRRRHGVLRTTRPTGIGSSSAATRRSGSSSSSGSGTGACWPA